MKVKLKDLADELNISVAAVSMAINGKKGVSDETRLEVLELAGSKGYIVKEKSLLNSQQECKSSCYIKLLRIKKHGLVVADTAFFAKLIEGIEEETKKFYYELVVSNINLTEMTTEWVEIENNSEMIGVIILATELDETDLEILTMLNKPFVVLDSYMPNKDWDCILMNNRQAARLGVRYLVEQGHKRIGYLKSNMNIYNFSERYNGYLEVVNENKLDIITKDLIGLEPTIEGAYRDMDKYLQSISKKDLPTAFMADNDLIAVGAMNALLSNGYKVPVDVSIIGIDDMPCGTIVIPNLTTIRIYKKEIGRLAVDRLISHYETAEKISKKIEINTRLVIRQSVFNILKSTKSV